MDTANVTQDIQATIVKKVQEDMELVLIHVLALIVEMEPAIDTTTLPPVTVQMDTMETTANTLTHAVSSTVDREYVSFITIGQKSPVIAQLDTMEIIVKMLIYAVFLTSTVELDDAVQIMLIIPTPPFVSVRMASMETIANIMCLQPQHHSQQHHPFQ